MGKILLTQEKETLLIPLYGKAIESKKPSPIIMDTKAMDMIHQIDYDFSALKIPEKTNLMMCLRASLMDDLTKDFLSQNKDSTVLHLGCGLDSRYYRIQDNNVDWYDIDFKVVIDLRKLFFEETSNYHMISSSVTDEDWIERLPSRNSHTIVVAEGLFMYLKEDDIKKLLISLRNRLGSFILIFDAFSVFTAKKVNNHPSIKKTGAVIKWGIDNPEELKRWGMDIEFLGEEYFTSDNQIKNLSSYVKLMFKIASLSTFVKKAHRVLVYKVC